MRGILMHSPLHSLLGFSGNRLVQYLARPRDESTAQTHSRHYPRNRLADR